VFDSTRKYIQKNRNPVQEYRIGDTVLLIKNQLTGDIDINRVLLTLKQLPEPIIQTADAICVGDFLFLKKRQVDAIFDERMIYISNVQESESEFLKNLIHEFAHGCEETYYGDIYEDGQIKDEFLKKRHKLFEVLTAYGYNQMPKESYLNPEYDTQFDEFLYKTIGYAKLSTLSRGIFVSPYAATSLREYFANGFENYFLADKEQVKSISPVLFSKLELFSNIPV
jgi:hypothetical protein